MTENKAIETLQDIHDVAECRIKSGDQRGVVYIPPDKLQDFNIAISALEEIQQYRALGTVKEIKSLISENEEEFNMLMKYLEIGTPEELREAMNLKDR